MIEKMMPPDVPQIAKLEKLCFSDPWSEDSIATELDNPFSLWLVKREEGQVLAYVGSQSVPPEADVMNLAVAPQARRKGLGRQLMLTLMELLHSRGMESLTLEVRASNEAAIALYKGLGFMQVGRRPKYYVNPKEDALIMRKELNHADFSH